MEIIALVQMNAGLLMATTAPVQTSVAYPTEIIALVPMSVGLSMAITNRVQMCVVSLTDQGIIMHI